MVNARLVYFLEEHGLINKYQCKSCLLHSSWANLVRLEMAVQGVHKQVVLSVSFYLEKAYDTV